MKKIAIANPGSGELQDLEIMPGTTPNDIISQLNLEGYMLAKLPTDGNPPSPLSMGDNIYPNITDGETLVAVSKADVG